MVSRIKRILVKSRQYPRQVPLRTLIKGTGIIMMAPVMLLFLLSFYDYLDLHIALYGAAFVFVMSIIFVRPYIANLSALTNYVNELSLDKRAEAPDLSFLNNVEELSGAVERLHKSWEKRKNQLEAIVAEGKILIDSLPDILIMLDKNLKIIQTNSKAKEIFGGKFFKETLERIVTDEYIAKAVEGVMKDREGRDVAFFLSDPFNRYFIIRVERFPIYTPGKIAVIIAMHDITEQKRTEQVLADFVANASHEIRTPLTSLVGFIETLQTSAKDDPTAREEFLNTMKMQAERMSKLVKDLLSLSQIEKDITTSPKDKVGIKTTINDVVSQLQTHAAEKDIIIDTKIKGTLPKIIGDSGQITQVFENIIGNAIKYGKRGTNVKINAEVIKNNFKDEKILRECDELLSISVEDEGEGIAKEHIPRLTERFYRIDTARSRKIGGTGLGLSIVKHILERHKAALKIESEEGKGSKFTVLLPVSVKKYK